MTLEAAIVYLREEFSHAKPWMENFRTSEDGLEFTDDFDGPPYEIWHTGGLGGPIGSFDDLKTCQAVVAIINDILEKR